MPYIFAAIGFALVPLLLIVGLVRPKTFARGAAVPSRGKIIGYAALAMVVSFVGILATAPGDETAAPAVAKAAPTPSVTDQVGKYSSRITQVTTAPTGQDRQYLRIVLHMQEGWDGASTFNAAAEEMLRVLQDLKKHHTGQFGTVNFSLTADLVDANNKRTTGEVIAVTFDMPKVEGLEFDNLLNQRLLDGFTTQAGATAAGEGVLIDWCKKNQKLAPSFCKLAGV